MRVYQTEFRRLHPAGHETRLGMNGKLLLSQHACEHKKKKRKNYEASVDVTA